jgi:F0F1-type ATP synthase membrane subunit b/b'
MDNIIFEIADLQFVTLDNVTFGYDKVKSSFADAHEYKQERAKYYRKAYNKLLSDFRAGVNDIVAQMNDALPQKQKDLNKANASK